MKYWIIFVMKKTYFDSKYLFYFISYTYYRATYVQFLKLLLD